MTGGPGDPDDPGAPGPQYPPPMFAPAAEPTAPVVVSGEISAPAPVLPAPAPMLAAPLPDEPLLPPSYNENDLRAAIGSPAMPEHIRPGRARDDDHDDDAPRSRRTLLVVGASLFLGLGIAALVVLGKVNAGRYTVSCGAKEVAAEQGRSFPPWGTSRLGGDAWKPIALPPSFQCVGLETDDETELGDAYRKLLVDRAEAMLTAKDVTQVEDAAALLDQALLHARSDSDPHKSARQAIQRLLGDVAYWRAAGKVQKAAESLTEAAKQYEAAAGQRPRYASDANAWATYSRKLLDDLRAGPAGARTPALGPAVAPVPSAPDRPAAPPGVALPVEPTAGSSGGSAEPAPAAPDAGVPSGGVLL